MQTKNKTKAGNQSKPSPIKVPIPHDLAVRIRAICKLRGITEKQFTTEAIDKFMTAHKNDDLAQAITAAHSPEARRERLRADGWQAAYSFDTPEARLLVKGDKFNVEVRGALRFDEITLAESVRWYRTLDLLAEGYSPEEASEEWWDAIEAKLKQAE